MLNDQPMQCNFCFHSFGPFYEVRILPITPVTTLSGAATPIHARIPGARKIVCHHCRYSHYNIEPWTEPDKVTPSSPADPAPEPANQNPELLTHPENVPSLSPADQMTATEQPFSNAAPSKRNDAAQSCSSLHGRQIHHATPSLTPISTLPLPDANIINKRSMRNHMRHNELSAQHIEALFPSLKCPAHHTSQREQPEHPHLQYQHPGPHNTLNEQRTSHHKQFHSHIQTSLHPP